MNQAPTASATSSRPDRYETAATIVEERDAVQNVLDALDDENCQAILELTSGTARSAKEVSSRCEIPPSTTYRKLRHLTEADLVEERTRVRRSGKHTSEYVRSVTDVLISVTADGQLALRLFRDEGVDYAAPDDSG